MPVRVAIELAVSKIAAQQPEFPKMISNVLSHVGYRAIRAHNDFGVLVGARLGFRSIIAYGCGLPFSGLRRRGTLHHPAALVLALSFVIEDYLLLHLFKRE